MFETYTEAARKTIFMGRYEASQFGSESIEIEHILLGLLRADLPLAFRVFKSQDRLDEVRQRITRATPRTEQTVTPSADLPLSQGCERALNYAAAEASRLNQSYIAAEHLLLGIVRENTSIAARIVLASGITFSQLEKEAERSVGPDAARTIDSPQLEGLRDLVLEARQGKAGPLIGRKQELDQVVQILSRRTKNSPVLIGEPGVGKNALIHGLARLIADGDVPPDLQDRQILLVDASELTRVFGPNRSLAWTTQTALQQRLSEASRYGGPLLYVRGLFDGRQSLPGLAGWLRQGNLQLITTGAALAFRLALERDDELARSFEIVSVLPPTEAEAIEILTGVKEGFERFHRVAISAEVIRLAVSASGRFFRQRSLPERAIDLIDDAGARVKLRREAPTALVALRKRLRMLARELENAIASHNFGEAKKLSEEEVEAREQMAQLRNDTQQEQQIDAVTTEDVLEVIAARTSLTATSVRAALERAQSPDLEEQIRSQLSARVPVGRRDWIEGLLAYLADCSSEDADQLAHAVQAAKTGLASVGNSPGDASKATSA